MNDDTLHDSAETVENLKELVLSAALLGETMKELSVRKRLDVFLSKQGISDEDARVQMAASDQLIRCIRNGMGINQALVWMCNAGWPSRIGHLVLNRLGV